MSVLAVIVSTIVLANSGAADGPALPQKTVEGMVKRMMEVEAFVGSRYEREGRRETGRFFSEAERRRLKGNPVLGYWDGGTFAWGGGPRVAWDGIVSAHPTCARIRGKAWASAFRVAARKQGLEVVKDAGVRVSGGCVAAVVDPHDDDPVPGVLLELRVASASGTLLVRAGVGKPTVEDAMGAALEFSLSLAQKTAASATRGASR